MHKVTLLILLFALACVTFASGVDMEEPMLEFEEEGFSQASIIPTDSEEVSSLDGKSRIFTDFCLTSRDLVIGDIKRTTSGLASSIFTLFFKSAEEAGLEALSDLKNFAAKEAADLKGLPSAEDIISNEQRAIVESDNKPKSIFDAVTRTIGAFGSSVSSIVVDKLEAVKSVFGLGEVVGALVKSCGKIGEYDQRVRQLFTETQDEISQIDTGLGNVNIETVNCVTTKRLLRIEGLCKIVRITQHPLVKILFNMNQDKKIVPAPSPSKKESFSKIEATSQ